MKRIAILFMITCWASASGWAQNSRPTTDSAEMIIDRYVKILNHDAIKADSMLYIESIITFRNMPEDSMLMKRWFLAPYSYRTEVWHKDTLVYGLVSNGTTVHRRFRQNENKWKDISISQYMDDFPGYDFHGPFSHYKVLGWQLHYQGIWDFNGHEVYKIFVQAPQRFDRYYLFEKENNLLFLIDEQDTYDPSTVLKDTSHVDWRAYHEFTPLGNCVFPTIESYQYEGEITILHSRVSYKAIDVKLFEK